MVTVVISSFVDFALCAFLLFCIAERILSSFVDFVKQKISFCGFFLQFSSFSLDFFRFCGYYVHMLTISEIEKWLKAKKMSKKQLAERLHLNYKALCPVLAGTRPLSARLSATIEELMNETEAGFSVKVPPEYEDLLRTWAQTANKSVDELVCELLADVLKVKKDE